MKKNKNIIEEKKEKLELLKQISTRALDIVTDTIEQLSTANDSINETINEIMDAKLSLQNTENELNQQKTKNARIIEKFKALVE